jgi:hypothetical protein
LSAGGQGQPACVQPVQEGGGVGDLVADVFHLLVGSGLTVEAAA